MSVLAIKQTEKLNTLCLLFTESPVLVPEPEPERVHIRVEFNKEALDQLLEKVVTFTEGFNVERLQKLYSVFSQCVVRHRNNLNKGDLIQV